MTLRVAFVSEDGVSNARGRVLGGSSAINAGFYSRADQDFFRDSGISWDLRVVGTKIGGSTFDSAGRRHSAADLLSYAKPSNIKVAVYASVERVLFASSMTTVPAPIQSAIGVVFRDQTGGFHHAMLRDMGEVLLCAGAIGSPQLLLLSGIGPRPYLSSWGIPVVHHQPYVGQFLYDNPRNAISIVPSMPLEHSLIQVVGITNSGAKQLD